jgi:hypothetical protein
MNISIFFASNKQNPSLEGNSRSAHHKSSVFVDQEELSLCSQDPATDQNTEADEHNLHIHALFR